MILDNFDNKLGGSFGHFNLDDNYWGNTNFFDSEFLRFIERVLVYLPLTVCSGVRVYTYYRFGYENGQQP